MALGNKSREYKICVCRDKDLGQVEDYIREHNITDLAVLCEAMNIGNKCGACREELEELLTRCQG